MISMNNNTANDFFIAYYLELLDSVFTDVFNLFLHLNQMQSQLLHLDRGTFLSFIIREVIKKIFFNDRDPIPLKYGNLTSAIGRSNADAAILNEL
jgi:hypothetical protein